MAVLTYPVEPAEIRKASQLHTALHILISYQIKQDSVNNPAKMVDNFSEPF